ncbi:TolC family protein [Gemmatimonas sp.]|uniref:TolC family protein n=1 Tax=Gemmatimonas sp. TaxID=1962908 RepID=UPI0039834323
MTWLARRRRARREAEYEDRRFKASISRWVGACAMRAVGIVMPVIATSTVPVVANAQVAEIARKTSRTTTLLRADSTVDLGWVYDAVDRASPRVRAAQALARATAARVPGATRPPDPELQFGMMNYLIPRLTPDPTLGMRQVQLMQMWPLPGKLRAAGSAARARAEAAEARAADVRWDARALAAMAFYELWSSRARQVIAGESRQLLGDVAAVARAMYRVGDGRQADVLRAQVEIARMDEEIIRMQAMAEAAQVRLAALASVPERTLDASMVLPVFPESLPPRASMESLALTGRAMLAAGEAMVRAAASDAQLARRERWPDLRLGLQYGERKMDMGTDRMGSAMIGASLPIHARYRQARMRDEAAAMSAMAEFELRDMQNETRARVAEVYATLARARRLATLYRTTIVPQADAAAMSSLASYRTGAIDFMAVLDNRMTVNRYREELLALVAEEGRAWAEIEMLTNREWVPLVGRSR